jgi:hypothetical protein
MADRKNKLGLSVAIGAGVGAALGVALHHLPFWLSLGCVGGIVTGIILTRMTRSWFSHGILVVCVCCWYCCLWYGEPDAISNTVEYAKFFSRSHHAVIRVYDEAGNVIETQEQAGDFKEPWIFTRIASQFPLRISHKLLRPENP